MLHTQLGPSGVWLAPALGFVLGTCIGSFLNVVIWRVPRGESVVSPPSHCPTCDRVLGPIENIPLVSWLVQRGRCRGCGSPISARYPLVELLTAIAFAVVAQRAVSWPALPATFAAVSGFIALNAIWLDLREMHRGVTRWTVVFTAVVVVATMFQGHQSARATAAINGGLITVGVYRACQFATVYRWLRENRFVVVIALLVAMGLVVS